MFFPYSLNLRLYGTPYVTVLIASICFLFFSIQILEQKQYLWDSQNYCQYELTKQASEVLDKVGNQSNDGCAIFFIKLHHSNDMATDLEFFAFKAQISEQDQLILAKEYERYESLVQSNFTSDLWHDPTNPTVVSYFTSSILHGDAPHLIFNLVFFFAFAIALEQTLGSILFALFCGVCCVTTALAYENGLLGASGGALPTIGLSGVVMGVMGFCMTVYPFKKIKVFYWFYILAGSLKLPILFVVGFYVVSDLYGLKYLTGENNVNYVSHVAGAFTGISFGVLYLIYQFVKSRFSKP